MKTGDTVMFRGRRRFVLLDRPGGINLEALRGKGHVAYYSVGAPEKANVRVLRRATKRDVTRARRLMSLQCPPWTRIQWGDDGQPHYIHDLDHPTLRKRRAGL